MVTSVSGSALQPFLPQQFSSIPDIKNQDDNFKFPAYHFQSKQGERLSSTGNLMQVLKIWEDSDIVPFSKHGIAFIYTYFYLMIYVHITSYLSHS